MGSKAVGNWNSFGKISVVLNKNTNINLQETTNQICGLQGYT